MTSYRLKSTSSRTSFLVTTSDNNYCNQNNKPNPSHYTKKRSQSQVGTDSYNRSLRRAFARAKLIAFFNPQLNNFITLTYKDNLTDPHQVIQDIKLLVKNHNNKQQHITTPLSPSPPHSLTYREETPPPPHAEAKKPTKLQQMTKKPVQDFSTAATPNGKAVVKSIKEEKKDIAPTQVSDKKIKKNEKNPFQYIYVMEYQKRGAIHVHMVANDALEYETNKNGYLSVKDWSHGFSSVLKINDVDINFKPYLYLFKYMSKAQRIGSSFVHISKNFDKIETIDYRDYIDQLKQDNLLYTEDQEFTINERTHRIIKKYYRQTAETNS